MKEEQQSKTAEEEPSDVRGVLRDETRLRELRREKQAAAADIADVDTTIDADDASSARIQRGTIRDYERDESGRRTTYTFTVTAESTVVEASATLPTDEYTLDNDLVMLLEWRGIHDGRLGALLDEKVYVDTEKGTFVLPSSMSPVARLAAHVRARGERYVPSVERNVGQGVYLTGILLSCLISFGLVPFFASFGAAGILMMLVWIFAVGPALLGALLYPSLVMYHWVQSWWNERYHEV